MSICVLGIFVADATFRTSRLPVWGETVLGSSFALGPGGKGSNQAVAAAKAGGEVEFITRLGDDTFADMAERIWREAGVTAHAPRMGESYTGSAGIFVDDASGENAIVVAAGAASLLDAGAIEAHRKMIGGARIFVTQLEQPLAAAKRALEIARAAGVTTIVNPAPAAPLDDDVLALIDIITPNETEAELLTGESDPEAAAHGLHGRGVGTVIVTLGEQGALVSTREGSERVNAFQAGPVLETTGAGDAFNGALAVALSEGLAMGAAARFACAAASISVTRMGAAASSPVRAEIDALLQTT